jgi:hypothetical protein
VGVIVRANSTVTGLDVTILNSTFTNSTARCDVRGTEEFFTTAGGAVGVFAYDASVSDVTINVSGCTFEGNTADYGGGIEVGTWRLFYLRSGSWGTAPVLGVPSPPLTQGRFRSSGLLV